MIDSPNEHFEDRIVSATRRYSELTLILCDLLSAGFSHQTDEHQMQLIEDSVASYNLDLNPAPAWMVDFLTRQLRRSPAQFEIPAKVDDLVNVLLDIDHQICRIGLHDYGEGIDWPILLLGTRTTICRKFEKPGFYGTNVHLVSYFEIALDLDPYLPEGESVHLLKNSRQLPYRLITLETQRATSPPPIALINRENDIFAIARCGFGWWCTLSSISEIHVIWTLPTRTHQGSVSLEVELLEDEPMVQRLSKPSPPPHTPPSRSRRTRVCILTSYRYSKRVLAWFKAQANHLTAVLRLPCTVQLRDCGR